MLNLFDKKTNPKNNIPLSELKFFNGTDISHMQRESVKHFVGNTSHYPPASKEWFNSIYSYNKNFIKTLPLVDKIVNKLIKSYFNLNPLYNNRILVSRAEMKHINNKVIITVYLYNKNKRFFLYKLKNLYKIFIFKVADASKSLLKIIHICFKSFVKALHLNYITVNKLIKSYFNLKLLYNNKKSSRVQVRFKRLSCKNKSNKVRVILKKLSYNNKSHRVLFRLKRVSYKELFIFTITKFFRDLSLKKLKTLFVNSFKFRAIIIVIGLLCPVLITILTPTIIIFNFIVKPYCNSKGSGKIFFHNFIYTVLIFFTLVFMWHILTTIFIALYPLLAYINSYFLMCNVHEHLNYNSYTKENFPVKEVEEKNNLDEKIIEKNQSKKAGVNYNKDNIASKLYHSIFKANNKPVNVIKVFSIIKCDFEYSSLLKSSSFNYSESSTNNSTGTNSFLSDINNSKLLDNIPDNIFRNIEKQSSSNHSETSSYKSDITVIDLEVLTGKNSSNHNYLVLKDKNDLGSDNLLNIINNPHDALLLYDKNHYIKKDCSYIKYYSHGLYDLNTLHSENALKKYKLNSDNIKEMSVSFNICEDAFNRIKNNTLIVESNNMNLLPIKETTLFAVNKEDIKTGNLKIKIPFTHKLNTIDVMEEKELDSRSFCQDCMNKW